MRLVIKKSQGLTATTLPSFHVSNGMFQRLCSARNSLAMILAAALERETKSSFLDGALEFVLRVVFISYSGNALRQTSSHFSNRKASRQIAWCYLEKTMNLPIPHMNS